MCTVSVITTYGQTRIPEGQWTTQTWSPFTDLVKQAEIFDKAAGQPDCVDPEKEAWMKRIEERLAALEAAAFRAETKS